MKLWTLLALAAAGVSSLSLGTPAATPPAGNSVAFSLHNLSIVYPGSTNDKYGTQQVCLPCHTPHQMPDISVGKLWNHQLGLAASYTLYSASSTNYLATIDEVSRKCLGCHDGTIAVDSFGSHTGTRGTIAAGYIIGANRNLQHDHPIDVLYNSAGNYVLTPTTTNGVTTYNPVWAATARNNDPATFSITGYTSQTWGPKVYTQTALSAVGFYTPPGATTTITDSAGHTGTVASKYVYCRSCHDPHNNQYAFMRVPNDGSQLCLTCHNK